MDYDENIHDMNDRCRDLFRRALDNNIRDITIARIFDGVILAIGEYAHKTIGVSAHAVEQCFTNVVLNNLEGNAMYEIEDTRRRQPRRRHRGGAADGGAVHGGDVVSEQKREIKFTQFLMPFGTPKPVSIDRPVAIADMADAIVASGYRFECEMLPTHEISVTITNKDGDHAIVVVPNGPEVPAAIDRMIEQFHATLDATGGA